MTEKRKPGRPRRHTEPRRHVTLILSDELLDALDEVTDNRSAFIEQWVRQHPAIAQTLTTAYAREVMPLDEQLALAEDWEGGEKGDDGKSNCG